MIIIMNRELLIPDTEQYIGTTQDNESEVRLFRMNRYSQNGVDLSSLTYRLDLKYPDTREVYTFETSTSRSGRTVVIKTTSFVENYPEAGTYTFTFTSGTGWSDGDQVVDLDDIGVCISFTPATDDTITVVSTIDEVETDTVALDSEVTDDYIYLTWTITSNNVAVPGTVFVSIRAINSDSVVRWSSFPGIFTVETNEYVTPQYSGNLSELQQYESALVEALRKAETLSTDYEDLESAIEDAEAWAIGTRDGVDVDSDDATYENNSKYYAELAADSESAAAESATAAEASAVNAATTVTTLSAQFANAISAVTTDTEVTDIRVSADGETYDTAGDAVRGQIGTLTDAVKGVFIPTVTSINSWVQGSITVEGDQTSTPYKVRSGGYITFDTDYPRVTVVVPSGMKISYREYSQEETDAEYLVSGSDWSEGSLSLSVSASYFYRFVLAYTTDSTNITPSDVSDDTVYYTTYAATDTTLTQSGKAADAKVTGEYIDSLANAGNLINNTLVPSVDDIKSRPKIGNTGYFYKYDKETLATANHGITFFNNGGARVCGAFVSSDTDFDNAGLDVATNYTLSFDLEYQLFSNDTSSGSTRYLYLFLCEADEDTDLTTYTLIDTSMASDYLLIASLEDEDKGVVTSTHIEWTFALASTTKHFSLTIKSTSVVSGYATGTDYITLANLMLQKGSYATAWNPSYADMFAYIDEVKQDTSVVGRNDRVSTLMKLQQLNRPTRTASRTLGADPLCLLWFSDIHGDETCLQNIITFAAEYSDYIQDILHTGDMVTTYSTDGVDFWDNVEGAENILNVIGNHDTRVDDTWIGLSMAESYAAYFEPYIENWGVTYTEDLTYYYKDYTTPGVRLIVLDIMHQTDDQLTWFTETLADANTNGYHVLVAVHSRAHWEFDSYDTPWDDKALVPSYTAGYSDTSSSNYPQNLSNDYADAVDDFITDGGIFIAWLHGHTHFKMFALLADHPNQLDISVANAGGTDYAWTYVWARIPDSKSEDDFNVLAVDTESKILRIAKFGVDYDRYMRHVDTISYDYANHILLYSN